MENDVRCFKFQQAHHERGGGGRFDAELPHSIAAIGLWDYFDGPTVLLTDLPRLRDFHETERTPFIYQLHLP